MPPSSRSPFFKSALQRLAPPLYEYVQGRRDRRAFAESLARGSFAQHGEDTLLLGLLRKLGARGPYADVGCNHPFRLSNTYLLYRQGWRGVCIDPLPRFTSLYRRWRPEDRFLCAGVGSAEGTLPFHEFESDVLSTFDAALAEGYVRQGYRRRRRLEVPIRPLDALLGEAGVQAPLSLLSIDIEGREADALRSIDLAHWRPAVVCLEIKTADGGVDVAAQRLLVENGYVLHASNGLNAVFTRP